MDFQSFNCNVKYFLNFIKQKQRLLRKRIFEKNALEKGLKANFKPNRYEKKI
jgi:hypothetical protein